MSVVSCQRAEGRGLLYFVVPYFLVLGDFFGFDVDWLDVFFFSAELAFTLFLVFATVCSAFSWAFSWAVSWGLPFVVIDFFSEKIRSQLEENWTVDPV